MNIDMQFPLFGKDIVIGFDLASEQELEGKKEPIVAEALRLQKIFNFYDAGSELSQLNTLKSLQVSKELLEVLKTALVFCELTDGVYDISKGREFLSRKQGIRTASLSGSYKDITIKENLVSLNQDDLLVDLGSIAKGYIVDSLSNYLQSLGFEKFIIDARGDMLIHNYRSDVGVQHPRSNTFAQTITLEQGAIATSGDYMQYLESFDQSHLLNNKDFSSVTVIDESLMMADVLATVLSVSGEQFMKDHTELFKENQLFILDKKGDVVMDTLHSLLEVETYE